MDEPGPHHVDRTGVVRVGDTVRRPAHARTPYVDAVLRHLEAVGFDGAPRTLGVDAEGRQVVTWIEGTVPRTGPYLLDDDQLVSAAGLVRAFHDATAGTALAGDQEVVRHGDLGPHNTVFRGSRAVALIDWDDDVRPGRRLDDVAHAAWGLADLTSDVVPVRDQARRLRLVCSVLGNEPGAVLTELTDRFERARADHAVAGRSGAVAVFERLAGWTTRHRAALLR
ncbi:phosphotransferase [Actinotalea ferrariae]|uniref:phosphotransferase n=1 Tax=Actinotalea ferrariae TaxID=1386098 RepID=UPI001C8C6B88|nr:phosphotransferase [Actinotalea ferrariae]MBX9244068.1 phosphotransferase [Actinotalea ferrariae]